MDNIKTLMRLRPDTTFKNEMVNGYSLESIAKTYIGDDLPTQTEMDAEWLLIQNEELTEKAEIKLKDQARIDKLTGVDFDGVMCSATSEDMWGLSSIKSWVKAGNDVNFEFQNKNILVLTQANIATFEAVWIPFRASFFN